MYIFLLLSLLVSTVSCQKLEDGWKGIQPLKTRKSAVEKILKAPEASMSSGYVGYSTEVAYLRVTYAEAPCSDAPFGRGEFNVPENTVIHYTVQIRKSIEFSEVEFAKEKYTRRIHEHSPSVV